MKKTRKTRILMVLLGCTLAVCSFTGCETKDDIVEEDVKVLIVDENEGGEENGISQEIVIP